MRKEIISVKNMYVVAGKYDDTSDAPSIQIIEASDMEEAVNKVFVMHESVLRYGNCYELNFKDNTHYEGVDPDILFNFSITRLDELMNERVVEV